MKKIFFTIAICFVGFFGVQAQQTNAKTEPTISQKVDKMMTSLTSACNLTPDQAAKIKPIVTEAANERAASKEKYSSDPDKLQAANKATMAETTTKINAILNADQKTKFVAFEKQMQQNKANTTSGNQ